MVELGRSYLHFDRQWTSDEALELSASRAFDIGEEAATEFLAFFAPVEVEVILVEGSGRLTTKFRSLGSKALIGLTLYGGVRTGIDYAGKDIRRAASYAIEQFQEREAVPQNAVRRTRRDASFPRKVRRILEAVERGQLSVQQGTHAILTLVGPDAEVPPETLAEIEAAIRALPVRQWVQTQTVRQGELHNILSAQREDERVDELEAYRIPPDVPGPPPRRVRVVREGSNNEKRVRRE